RTYLSTLQQLAPETLLFREAGLPSDAKQQLSDVFNLPGNPNLRLDILHVVVPLLHAARKLDPERFHLEIFIPWSELWKKTEANRRQIYAALAEPLRPERI